MWFGVGFADADAALVVVAVGVCSIATSTCICVDQMLAAQKRRQIPKTSAGVDNEVHPGAMDDVYVGHVPGIVVSLAD